MESTPEARRDSQRRPRLLSRLGLTGRVIAGGAGVVLLVGASFAGLIWAITELRAADAAVTRSATNLRAAFELEKLLIDMETGLRGFVITQEERFLEPWNLGREQFPLSAQQLVSQDSEESEQSMRLQSIASLGMSYIGDYGEPLIAAARVGHPSAFSVATTEQGKARMDELRSLFASYIETERAAYLAQQGTADHAADIATVGATVGLAICVALIALASVGLSRTIVAPVTRAADMAGRLAAGELTIRMPETDTAEIGRLERSFNSLAVWLAKTLADLAASRSRIVEASDETRRMLERNLHDGAQQRLVSLSLRLRSVQSDLPADAHAARAGLEKSTKEIAEILDELREISRGIYPAILSRGGLNSALKTLARRSPVPVKLHLRSDANYAEPIQVAAYYLVAEALTNAAKHAEASVIEVSVEQRDGVLHVSVRDNGRGGATLGTGSGLIGLRDRVEALGGRLDLNSPAGNGTTLVAELPVR